jgi:hypothetical protein
MIRIFGLVIPINQLEVTEEPPFDLDDDALDDLIMVQNGTGWALLWVLRKDGFEFGMSLNWAYDQCRRITRELVIPKYGHQTGEYQVVMFELERGEDIDLELMVERFDWTTGVNTPC